MVIHKSSFGYNCLNLCPPTTIVILTSLINKLYKASTKQWIKLLKLRMTECEATFHMEFRHSETILDVHLQSLIHFLHWLRHQKVYMSSQLQFVHMPWLCHCSLLTRPMWAEKTVREIAENEHKISINKEKGVKLTKTMGCAATS